MPTLRTASRLALLSLTLAALTAGPVLAGGPRHHPRHGPPGAHGHGRDATSFRLGLGLFTPDGDSEFWRGNEFEFTGDAGDLDDAVLTADVRIPVGSMTSVMLSASHFSGESRQAYRDFTDSNGFDIEHDTRLSVTPLTLGLVLHPIGRGDRIAPYVGAGAGFWFWSYEETGDFIVFDAMGDPGPIVFEELRGDGVATGWFALAGLDIPISRYVTLFGEARWNDAEDDQEDDFSGLGEIDLSGRQFTAGLSWRF